MSYCGGCCSNDAGPSSGSGGVLPRLSSLLHYAPWTRRLDDDDGDNGNFEANDEAGAEGRVEAKAGANADGSATIGGQVRQRLSMGSWVGSSPDSAGLLRALSDLRTRAVGGSAAAAAAAEGETSSPPAANDAAAADVAAVFTPAEIDVLLRTRRLLGERRRRSAQTSSFLVDLATAAASAELEEWNRYRGDGNPADADSDSDHGSNGGPDHSIDPERQVKALLDQARRSSEVEAASRRRLKTLSALEEDVLPAGFGARLGRELLGLDLVGGGGSTGGGSSTGDDGSADRNDDGGAGGVGAGVGDEVKANDEGSCYQSERRFLDVMSRWLGRSASGGSDDAAALDVVFEWCRRLPDQHGDGENDGGGSGSGGTTDEDGTKEDDAVAEARDLVELCYRVAVASDALDSCFLHAAGPKAEEEEGGAGATTDASTNDDDDGPSIPDKLGSVEPLVLSLLEFARERRSATEDAAEAAARERGRFEGQSSAATTTTATTATATATTVTRDEFRHWSASTLPALAPTSVSGFVGRIVLPGLVWDRDRGGGGGVRTTSNGSCCSGRFSGGGGGRRRRWPGVFPELFGQRDSGASSFVDGIVSPTSVFAFASMSPKKFGGQWHRLFSSDADGFSFNTVEHSICGYAGPTLLLISATTEEGATTPTHRGTFGAYTSTPWKKSGPQFFGDGDCFLFQLEPTFRVLRSRRVLGGGGGSRSRGGGNFMYFNSSTAGAPGPSSVAHARGLGLGGTTTRPRLFVSESMEECRAGSSDTSFEAGELFPSTTGPSGGRLLVDSLEMWGLGEDDDAVASAFGGRSRLREVKQSNIDKARTVDKSQFLVDFNSGLIESKMFVHKKQIEDR